jgi:hypothetical protein
MSSKNPPLLTLTAVSEFSGEAVNVNRVAHSAEYTPIEDGLNSGRDARVWGMRGAAAVSRTVVRAAAASWTAVVSARERRCRREGGEANCDSRS